jgi:hypothetical protein
MLIRDVVSQDPKAMLVIPSKFFWLKASLIAFLGMGCSLASNGAPNSWARLLVPIGHGPRPGVPFTIRSYTNMEARLSADGWFCYTQGRDPITLHGRKETDGRLFHPVVSYELATEDQSKWRKLREEAEQSRPDTVTVSPDNPIVSVTIDIEPLRGWIGTYRYGRVVLETGDAGIIELEDLLPTANARDATGNFKENVASGGAMLRHQFKLPRSNDPAVLSDVICLGDQLIGSFVFDSQSETVRLEGTRTLDGDFWPAVRLEAGNSDKNWQYIGRSPASGTPTTLQMSSGKAQSMRILLTGYKPIIGKYKFGKIVFSDGQSCVFYLDLLDPKR